MKPQEVGPGVFQIDLLERGIPAKTAGFLVVGETLAVVETGPATSADRLLEGIRAAGHDPDRVGFLVVTHVHLDHAGGAGLLSRTLPEARVVVHRRGVRHLEDPSRLVHSARSVWGPRLDEYFGETLPVPGERLVPVDDGDTVDLGGRVLRVIDTPGHAHHHICLYDVHSRGLFAGDAVGMSFDRGHGRFCLPMTPPPNFDPEVMVGTIKALTRWDVDSVYFTHFGCDPHGSAALERALGQLLLCFELARDLHGEGAGWTEIALALEGYCTRQLPAGKGNGAPLATERGQGPGEPWLAALRESIELTARGMTAYLEAG